MRKVHTSGHMGGITHEAAELAGHPTHSLGKAVAVQVAAGVAAGVGTYQVNRKLAKVQKDAPPAISPVTGGMPNNTGENVSKAASNIGRKYTGKRKGGR